MVRNASHNKALVLGIIVLLVSISSLPIVGSLSAEKHISNKELIFESGLREKNDTTPPITTISLNGTMSQYGIFSSEVKVTLNATDDLSGVNVTYYELDGCGIKTYTEPFMVGHGYHALVYRSVDNAGNVENWKHVRIEIDLIPPYVSIGWEILENRSVKFVSYVDDYGSGPYKAEYYIDSEYKHTAYNREFFEWIWIPPGPGYYVAKVIVYDKAENSGEDMIGVNVPKVYSQRMIHLNNYISRFNDVFIVNFKHFYFQENYISLGGKSA